MPIACYRYSSLLQNAGNDNKNNITFSRRTIFVKNMLRIVALLGNHEGQRNILYRNSFSSLISVVFAPQAREQKVMFKKHLEVKPSSNLKSSEKRRLQENVQAQVEGLRFPAKLSKALFNSNEVSKGTLFFDSESKDPVFFQLRDGKNLIPTLHELWASVEGKTPLRMPIIMTHEAVIERLVNGSDLMIRGCIEPFGEGLKAGAIVAVVDYKTPNVAMAVGKCLMDLEGKSEDEIPNSGKVVQVWTVVGDQLTSLGRSMDEILKEAHEKNTSDENTQDHDIDEAKETGADITGTEKELENITLQGTEEVVEVKEALDNRDDVIESDGTDEYVMSTEDIDDMFRRAVLYTLSQDSMEFPLLASQFMSGHVLKNLPPVDDSIVNMKKTSWKKTGKFLKAMEKETLVKLKGKDDKLSVVAVAQRSDPRVLNFVPYRVKTKNDLKKGKENTNGTQPLSSNTLSSETGVMPLIIKKYLKPSNSSRMMFNRLDAEYDHYYTENEIKSLVQRYIRENSQLVCRDSPAFIEPDDVLEAFCKGKKAKRVEVVQQVLNSCTLYHAVYREGDSESNDVLVKKRLVPKRGKPPVISITIESVKVGRRVATRVSGLDAFYVDTDKLADVLKVKCSGSCTITDDPKRGKTISVQGNHDTAVIDVLSKDWGVPPGSSIVDNKTNFKRKRK